MAHRHPTQVQIGRMIAKHRTERNLTQEEVAERMGIGSEAISRLERGVVELSVIKLMQLAEIFDCRMDELLTESSNRPIDQANMISGLLSDLKENDRAFILATVEQLAAHLGSK
ncbi:helix-turn-helix transcriptional regulator [Pseudomonas protegens]|uniref:helix-turn-helix domain-containing protein n=1 Tax=Pseudomonas TaxID=286 RepID=UPI001576C656|nr:MULTISPECIES: helix-turn-helix transcriptional regulator [Pseudomonas]MBB1612509.1 transcriptional regulator [Pseudomonas sp. UMC65]MBB1622757.1 transcriptional regulator [Pseudomonas sp. UME65]NTZ73189.1 helix-turn-helix transcriptional regulator [Pseudomonas protegens]UCZ85590.1 helix-turn-helix domain-containing protein [Pseudomonas sp. L5B5]